MVRDGTQADEFIISYVVWPMPYAALIVVSTMRFSGQENVRQENRRFAIFLSYIFLSAGRNDDQVPIRHTKYEIWHMKYGYAFYE